MAGGSKAAEESFKKGLEAYRAQKGTEALALFEAAVTLDSRLSDGEVNPRYRSYYGVCLILNGGKRRNGLALCRKAAQEEFYNPEMLYNLGTAEMEAGSREAAHRAFVRGLHLAPSADKKRFKRALEVLGMRRKPFFSFLPRRHPLNVMIGRMTWKARRGDDD